ncbi:hypothetical protein Bhyg_08890 [Pseudolycoriella hygida]|uniref:Uncharacterized protein n=1 Tax=Pseudolycoriella hygida TaxID=35572 RepID=A0A9Q0N5K4_9DIPT|nr:hypothetical protein Bhyg_08890 [Pseudolycoriella hygida]
MKHLLVFVLFIAILGLTLAAPRAPHKKQHTHKGGEVQVLNILKDVDAIVTVISEATKKVDSVDKFFHKHLGSKIPLKTKTFLHIAFTVLSLILNALQDF